jgi:hypothetical protein
VVAPVTLTSVSAAGADDALAGGAEDVGFIGAATVIGARNLAGLPLILRWNGRAWSKQRVVASFYGSVTDIAAGRGGAGWAIAQDAAGHYHLLHQSAGTWRETPFPGQGRPGLELTSIAAAPDGTAWATGASQPSASGGPVQAPLILHWVAGTWQRVPPPASNWWPVQIAATPSGVWLAGQVADHMYPLYWDVVLARRTANGWQAFRAPSLGHSADEFLTTGGTLGLAAVGASVGVAAAPAPATTFPGPAPYGAGPAPTTAPATLLRWAAGRWSMVVSGSPFNAVVAGSAGPVLITLEVAAPGSDLSTVPPPMSGFTASNPGALAQSSGQPGQISSVPGTSELWAVTANWIARHR